MTEADRVHWNQRYDQGKGPQATRANRRLASYVELVDAVAAHMQQEGAAPRALDVACGAGGTVAWLARRGWRVTGVDLSDAALALAQAALDRESLSESVRLEQVDLDSWRPMPAAYDLVCCFYFWDPTLLPALGNAVRPGGLLVCEAFNIHRLHARPGSNPAWLLQPHELAATVAAWGWELCRARSDGPEASRPADSIAARKPLLDS